MTDQPDYGGWTHDLWECCCSEGTARWKPHGDKNDPTLACIEEGGHVTVTPVRFCLSNDTRLHDEWIYQFRPLPLPLAPDNWTHQVFQCPKFVEPEHEEPEQWDRQGEEDNPTLACFGKAGETVTVRLNYKIRPRKGCVYEFRPLTPR